MTATKEGHLYTIELLGWLSTEPILADASPWSSGGWPEPRGRYSGAAGWTHWPRWPGNPDWPDIYQGRARAYLHDSSLFLEATWDHNGGLRYALLGIEPAHPQQAIIDAWHGLPLLIKHIRRGPKHGSRQAFENEAAYREALQDDVIKGRSSKELRSLQPWQIAKMLGISESTMHQTNKDYGINMADIRNGRITRS